MTQKAKVLRLLSDRKPHTHHELYSLGCVAHSRISDLRKDGHVIEQWREGNHYLYQLKGTLDAAAVQASEPPVSGPPPSSAAAASSVSNPAAADVASDPHREQASRDGTLVLFPHPVRGAYGDAA